MITPAANGQASIAYNSSMPRFTLQQLLAGVLFGCVYLAVLRDVFAGGTHNAVPMVAWVILAAFYVKWRLWKTLSCHIAFPLIVILTTLYLIVVSGFPAGTWRFHVFDESVEVLALSCRVSSFLVVPLAMVGYFARYLKKHRNTLTGTKTT